MAKTTVRPKAKLQVKPKSLPAVRAQVATKAIPRPKARAAVKARAQAKARVKARSIVKLVRPTKGVLLVLSNCADPAKEQSFNEWYDKVHVPEIVKLGSYHRATRFVNTEWKPDHPKYLAIYETHWDDPIAAQKAMSEGYRKLRESGKTQLFDGIKVWGLHTFRKLGEPIRRDLSSAGKQTKSIMLVLIDITDPAKDMAFHEWHIKEHIPDVLWSGSYHTATRYENVEYKPGAPKYLVIYSSEWEDANAARESAGKAQDELRRMGRGTRFGALNVLLICKFKRMS